MIQENIKRYHPLGNRTLFVMIFRRSGLLFFLVPLFFVALFTLGYIPSNYVNFAALAVAICFVFILLVFAGAFFLGWLQYFRYWIFVDDKDLKIARGLIAVEQIGIPYKHIQDVKIERTLVDQFFGVSDIVITVLGSGRNEIGEASNPGAQENIIVLPSLSKEIALEIQDITLKKAQVEQVNVLGAPRMG